MNDEPTARRNSPPMPTGRAGPALLRVKRGNFVVKAANPGSRDAG